jgi:putative sigma-54 modulation protein
MDLTRNLKEYAEEKIGRFSKYLNNITEASVTLSVEKFRHKAEVHLKANGSLLQAESITGEMYSSIDDVVEKLARQVKKHKDKIKNKSYDIKPMSLEEAAMQMDLLGKEFFIFTNASSGNINVLYKRNDGNFGLIEPIA